MQAYSCPVFFRDDWLNDYHCGLAGHEEAQAAAGGRRSQQDIITSDYRFVYLGPKALSFLFIVQP